MTIENLLKTINEKRIKLTSLDLDTFNLLKIVPYFRLDWEAKDETFSDDYNIGATKPVLFSGLNNSKHKIKANVLFQKNNKIAQLLIENFITKKRLSKELLKEMHSLIMVNGGTWRTQNVHVRNPQNFFIEPFIEASMIDEEITELIKWFNDNSKTEKINPILLSSIFHYEFIKIHPFLDGNGRLARIITSLILLGYGIPPPIGNSDDRYEYISSLRKADAGDLNQFVLFIGTRVLNSIDYVLSVENSKNV